MKQSKPIVCVDFDGVIHGYQSGWKGVSVIPDPPVPGAIQALVDMVDAGISVAIYSARSSNIFGRIAMKRWLTKHLGEHWVKGGNVPGSLEAECLGDAEDAIRHFMWPWFKPSAIMTIDDRALTFNGNWSDPQYSAESLRAFKPWNKK